MSNTHVRTRPAYTSETGQPTKAQRIEFVQARKAALSKQRDDALGRLDVIRAERPHLLVALMTGTASDPKKASTILAKHNAAQDRLIADVNRLNSKLG